MGVLLEVKNLGISFGGLRAVDGLNMTINEGALVGLIGPNGAGKTTAFNMLTGVYRPTDGTILLDGKSLVGKKPAEICQEGVARTFQNIRLFTQMSVLDNVKVALHNSIRYNLATSFLHLPSYFSKEKEMDEEALKILKIFELDTYANTNASNLPYGKQREAGDCPGSGDEPENASSGRTGSRHEPQRDEGTDGDHRAHPKRVQGDDPSDRA